MAVDSLDAFERRRGRAQYPDGIRTHRIQKLADIARQRCRATGISVVNENSRKSGERRVKHRFAVSGFALIEVFESLRHGQLKGVVIGKIALNDDLSRLVAPA